MAKHSYAAISVGKMNEHLMATRFLKPPLKLPLLQEELKKVQYLFHPQFLPIIPINKPKFREV